LQQCRGTQDRRKDQGKLLRPYPEHQSALGIA
jgi:hypothetical protein